ncbi:MAG: efflux RND transporter periplasmic adaptor subunit [Pyrinomonadaceae bacterium]
MKGNVGKNVLRVVLLTGFLGLLIGLLWFWLRPPEVRVTEVAERKLTPSIQGTGTVESKIVVMIAAKIPGRIISIDVDQGDTVENGQTLVTLEDTELNAEIERAEATLGRARSTAEVQRASIQRSVSGMDIQRTSLQRAITNVEVPRSALRRARTALTAAETNIAKAGALRDQAQANAKRWVSLQKDGVVSRMDTEERVTAAKAAEEDVKNAIAQKNVALEDIKNVSAQIKTAEEDVKQARAQLKASSDDVETLRKGLAVIEQDIRVAEAAVASAKAKRSDTVIASQFHGYVISRELEPGSIANPGNPILKIADPSTLWATVNIDEINTRSFKVGDPAEITLRSMQSTVLKGRVARIRQESDRVTEQTAVDITFDNIPENVRLGEQLEAVIRSQSKTVKAVPASALIRSKDGNGVWVVVDGRLEFRKIEIGLVGADGWMEIRSGVEKGDRVVVSPGKLSDPSNEGRRVSAVADQNDEETKLKQ